jgi:hypothetical protein
MAENSYLLFCIIERIQNEKQYEKQHKKQKDYFTKKEILKYIEPIALFWEDPNNFNFNLYIDTIMRFIRDIDSSVENNSLFLNDNKYTINKNHIHYQEYKECYDKKINKIELLTDSISLIINKKSSNEELTNTFENEESKDEELEDTYYVCESFTSNDLYFINQDLNHCSCLAFHYSDDKKLCKHIEYFKKLNYEELNKKYIIDTKSNSCNCSYFKNNSNCKHYEQFLEESSY